MQLALARRNEAMDAVAPEANSGRLRLYSGSVPALPETALGAQVLLAELILNATAFGASSGGVLTANPITTDASADASGTCSFARIYQSDGTTIWSQITSVGTTPGAFELVLSTLSITALHPVSCSSLTVTLPVGT